MTDCPRCGAEGHHEFVTLTREHTVRVGHVCGSPTCMLEWTEEARDPIAVLAAFGYSATVRQTERAGGAFVERRAKVEKGRGGERGGP